MSIEECRPDLVLMDIKIDGCMDGIQTARLLRHAYEVPVVFLTSYSDEETLARQLGGKVEYLSSDGCRVQSDLPRLLPQLWQHPMTVPV